MSFYSETLDQDYFLGTIVGIGAIALVSLVLTVVTYMVTKRHVEKKLKTSFESSDVSQDSCQVQRFECLWLPFSSCNAYLL